MYLKEKYDIDFTPYTETNIVNVLTNEFAVGSGKDTYINSVFIQPDERDFALSESFYNELSNSDFKQFLLDVINLGLYRYEKYYTNPVKGTSLKLYEKYTYEDACRLLEWEKNEVPTNIGGYKYNYVTKTYPVFINYEKDEDIQATIKYEDHFISQTNLIAISKSRRVVSSNDVQNALHSDELGIAMHLFVRKNKDDSNSKEFYYLGLMHPTGYSEEFVMPETEHTAVKIGYKLEKPVRKDLYEYITADSV